MFVPTLAVFQWSSCPRQATISSQDVADRQGVWSPRMGPTIDGLIPISHNSWSRPDLTHTTCDQSYLRYRSVRMYAALCCQPCSSCSTTTNALIRHAYSFLPQHPIRPSHCDWCCQRPGQQKNSSIPTDQYINIVVDMSTGVPTGVGDTNILDDCGSSLDSSLY